MSRLLSRAASRAWAVVLFVLGVAAVAGIGEYQRQAAEVAERDLALVRNAAESFEDALDQSIRIADSANALVRPDGTVDEGVLQRFASGLVRQPTVLSVAWQRAVRPEERAQVESLLDVPLRGWDNESTAVAGERELYLPIMWAWPNPYDSIVGRDLLSEEVRATAALTARDTGRTIVTSPLAVAPADHLGILGITPLYRPGLPFRTVEQRREAFAGSISVVHFADVLLSDVLRDLPTGSRVRVADDDRLLAETDPPPALDGVATELEVGGREWTITARHPQRIVLTNLWWIAAVGPTLALIAGVAVHRSQLQFVRVSQARDELAAVVTSVQEATLSEPSAGVGIETAVRYVPATEHVRLGGDWYDIFTTPDGRTVVCVGDASGHGVEAITHMQRVRQVVAAFAYEGHEPADALRLSHEVLGRESETEESFATVWLGYVDPRRATMRYANAGHPAALLTVPGARPVQLGGATGPPLHMLVDPADWEDRHVDLAPGSVVLVHTDGLVETRAGGIEAGLPRVVELLSGSGGAELEVLADLLMAARAEPGRDDAALVLVRLRSA